jgi:hypothetical protein
VSIVEEREVAAVRHIDRTSPMGGVSVEPMTAVDNAASAGGAPLAGTGLSPRTAGGWARLDARGIIDRAVATLTSRRGMTEREAFRWLQRTAIDRRSSMRAVALRVIAGRQAQKWSIGQQDSFRVTLLGVHGRPPTSRVVPG